MSDQPDETLRPDDQHDIEREIDEGWARFAQRPPDFQEAANYGIEPNDLVTEDVISSDEAFSEEDVIFSDEAISEADVIVSQEPITDVADQTPVEVVDYPREPFISVGTLLFRPKQAAALRVEGLTRTIEAHPNSAANYVLRGEMLLKLKRYTAAEMDFRRALDLAAAQVESEDWGVVAQVMQDRALAGLKRTRSVR